MRDPESKLDPYGHPEIRIERLPILQFVKDYKSAESILKIIIPECHKKHCTVVNLCLCMPISPDLWQPTSSKVVIEGIRILATLQSRPYVRYLSGAK